MTDQLRQSRSATRDRIVETAERLFSQHGYEFTTLAQIRKLARANSGSLHYFFPSKEAILAAVLERQKSLLGPQFESVDQELSDPIERIFAILGVYRNGLRETDFRLGCPVGNLALEVCNNHPKARPLIVENFQVWHGRIEGLIIEASDRLPAKTKPGHLAMHVLATMEGGVMLARAYRSLEPFDQSVNQLKDYFDHLLKDRAESESKQGS